MQTRHMGFTLIELLIVMVVVAIISVGTSGFIRASLDSFNQINSREALLRKATFAMERLDRELSAAVPNSVRVAGNGNVHCMQFTPIKHASFYFDIHLQPSADKTLQVINKTDIDGKWYTPSINQDVAIIYPTAAAQVYDASLDVRQLVTACTDDGDGDCASDDATDHKMTLSLADSFAFSSPARRVYFADHSISYCLRGGQLFRHKDSLALTQPVHTFGGTLMAQKLANQLAANPQQSSVNTQNPFTTISATLRRNAYTQIQLIFAQDGEYMSFVKEVQIPNVP